MNSFIPVWVVGIDIAGDEGAIRSSGDSEVFTDFDKEIFRKVVMGLGSKSWVGLQSSGNYPRVFG